MGTTINMMRINSFILINHLLAAEELDNGLNGRPSKLSENMLTAELTKINFFTPHDHIYLMIEVRFKIEEY
jgi:hypothetical protein